MIPELRIDWTPDCRRAVLKAAALAALSVAFVVTTLQFLYAHYTTNDDTGVIGFIVAGHPVPYTGILLTSLLHAAYGAAPDVAWFGWCLYALLTLSLYQWLVLAWRVLPRAWLALAATALILACYLNLVVSLDFTAVSAMLCMSALTRAGVEVLEPAPRPWALLVPGLVLAASWLVRPESVLGALAYAAPAAGAILIGCLWRRPFRQEAARLGLAALVFLSPLVLNLGVDAAWRAAVRTPQEAQYEAFNAEGGKFYHLSLQRREATGSNAALMAALHWSAVDGERFVHWKFLDERIYTPEAARFLWTHAAPPDVSAQLLKKHLRGRLLPRNRMFLFLAASLPLFVLLLFRGRPEAVAGLLLPAYSVALTVLMYVLYAFVYRVEMPFELGLGLMGMLLAVALLGRTGSPPSWIFLATACISLIIAGIGAGYSVRTTLGAQHHDQRVAAGVASELRMLNTQFAGAVVLMQPVSNGLNVLSPLHPIPLRFQPVNLGWNTFSPRFYEQIQALGAQHGYELIDAMVDNPRAYLLGAQPWARKLLSYATNHPRDGIHIVRVAQGLLQLRTTEHAGLPDPAPSGRAQAPYIKVKSPTQPQPGSVRGSGPE